LVFKALLPILAKPHIINFLKSICYDIGERYCFEFDAIGCDGDYVHLFVGAEPKKGSSLYNMVNFL